MKQKRLLCAVLMLVLLFSMPPARAAEVPFNGRAVEIEGIARIPIVEVTVPTSAEVYINPYELPVDIGIGRRDYGQILSTPACVTNYSNVAIQVDLTITARVREESTMRLSATPTGGAGTTKKVFIYFEMKQTNTDRIKYVEWDPAYDSTKHIVLKDGVSVKRTNFMKLPPITDRGKVADGGYAPFRLAGDAVTNPTDEWNEKDGIDVTIAFTFKPLPYREW